jgi:hypothetical protein
MRAREGKPGIAVTEVRLIYAPHRTARSSVDRRND